jgi:hypothetical protein
LVYFEISMQHGWCAVFFFVALLASPMSGQKSKPAHPVSNAATPQQVCGFITGRMAAALPQSPTLCSRGRDSARFYEIDIFSPTDVLEGNLRRA